MAESEFLFFKRKKILNVGLLNPDATGTADLEKAAKHSLGEGAFARLQIYKIEPEAFVEILESAYGIRRESLHAITEVEAHPTLRHYISTERSFL